PSLSWCCTRPPWACVVTTCAISATTRSSVRLNHALPVSWRMGRCLVPDINVLPCPPQGTRASSVPRTPPLPLRCGGRSADSSRDRSHRPTRCLQHLDGDAGGGDQEGDGAEHPHDRARGGLVVERRS